MTHVSDRIAAHEAYLHAPRGTVYAERRVRYQAAAERLFDGGLGDWDILLDVGAGRTELDVCLRVEHGWRGRYVPLDGWLDGCDLNTWIPPRTYDWAAAIEVLEHLHDPARLVHALRARTTGGIVVTTPNPDVWDVLAMDPTHHTPISRQTLEGWGFATSLHTFYGKFHDGICGLWTTPDIRRPAPEKVR